jgi:tRNA(Arg) A34 adenosine deaminase TadA
MLNHAEIEIIEHLEKAIDDVKIIDDSFVLTTTACEICALIKTHHVISRRFDQFESTSYSLNRIDFDLIFMHRAYNDD